MFLIMWWISIIYIEPYTAKVEHYTAKISDQNSSDNYMSVYGFMNTQTPNYPHTHLCMYTSACVCVCIIFLLVAYTLHLFSILYSRLSQLITLSVLASTVQLKLLFSLCLSLSHHSAWYVRTVHPNPVLCQSFIQCPSAARIRLALRFVNWSKVGLDQRVYRLTCATHSRLSPYFVDFHPALDWAFERMPLMRANTRGSGLVKPIYTCLFCPV